jgi:hypothetical protein
MQEVIPRLWLGSQEALHKEIIIFSNTTFPDDDSL